MNSYEAATYMNELGCSSVPFLFIIDFEKNKPLVFPLDDLPEGILFGVNGYSNHKVYTHPCPEYSFHKAPVPMQAYECAFNRVQSEIRYGNSFLLNLTFPTEIFTELTLSEIYSFSEARYKLLVPDNFVVFSPEIFVQIRKGKIKSFPMKGTIDAGIPNAKRLLLNDKKEIAEHYTIVDLIRNDLSMVARNVNVVKFRYIEKLKTHEKSLFQVSSEIEGDLPPDYRKHIGDLIMTLLPAGSICGAPKPKTVDIIRDVEGRDRGYYTGIFGYFNGSELDSGVMIRFIEECDQRKWYRSGGGITSQSELITEYKELLDKVYVPIHRKHQDPQRKDIQYPQA